MSKTRIYAYLVMFLSLSVVGAGIKIPLGISSLALDSAPALLAAIILGPIYGAIVGGLGHLLSAFFGGLPLGPFHALIAVEMAGILYLFGLLFKFCKPIFSLGFFIICNSALAPIPFYFLISPAFYWPLVLSLLLSSLCNVGIAVFIHTPLQNFLKKSAHYA
ncbi:ECF transporter S component [Bacillus sp. DJP31]|uniref:ECF transporter S component n=1 Tax=Bacillus sp. DJP31 TaxID=3409789 RepID=UPI003BB72F08